MGTTIQRTQARGYNSTLLDLRPLYNERVASATVRRLRRRQERSLDQRPVQIGINTGSSDAIRAVPAAGPVW